MADLLTSMAEYLRSAAAEPFAWGRSDCAFFAAGWVSLRTGIDVAAPYRQRFSSSSGSRRIVREAGGIVGLATEIAAAAGLARTEAPTAGDVGVIESAAGQIFAIRGATGDRWVAKHRRGVVAGPAPFVAAWHVPGRADG